MLHKIGRSDQFSCGWIGDLHKIPKVQNMLIKVHNFDQKLINQSCLVFYSYRDIRDALASNARKFGVRPTVQLADSLVSQHNKWMEVADYSLKYEFMVKNKGVVISEIAKKIGVMEGDYTDIAGKIDRMSYEDDGPKNKSYHEVNLFHKGHKTDGRHGSWHHIVDDELERKILERHYDWFKKNGYLS